MFRTIFSPGVSASTRNIVAPPASPGAPLVRAMQMANAAPSAPLMNHLRPSIRQPPSVRVAVVASARIGSGPRRRLGHGEAGTHVARGEWTQVPLLLLLGGHHLEQMHVALVGRRAVQREGTQQRPARGLEHDGLIAQIEPEAAELLADVRGEHPRRPRGLLKPPPQRFGPGVHVTATACLFLGYHHVADELRGAPCDRGDPLVDLEADGHISPLILATDH